MPVSEKKRASNDAWDSKNIKRTSLALRVDLHQSMAEHAALRGEKVNAFITRAIRETIERDNRATDGASNP